MTSASRVAPIPARPGSAQVLRDVSQRLSLRKPQRDALEVLAEVLNDIKFSTFVSKDGSRDVSGALEAIRAKTPYRHRTSSGILCRSVSRWRRG